MLTALNTRGGLRSTLCRVPRRPIRPWRSGRPRGVLKPRGVGPAYGFLRRKGSRGRRPALLPPPPLPAREDFVVNTSKGVPAPASPRN